MATKSYIGKTLYVAKALPATNDKAGFEALTWVKVNGLQQLPQLAITHNNIDVPDLQTGFTIGIKGAATGADSQMAFYIVANDQGQLDLKEQADDAAGVLSVKIVRGSGPNQAPATGDPVQYAQGYAHSYQEVQGNDTAHEGFTVNFKQNAATVMDVHPTV